MQITIEGVDRSTTYQRDELDAIQIQFSGDMGASEPGEGTLPVPSETMSEEASSGQQALIESDGETILDGFIGAMNRDRNGVAVGARQVFRYALLDENALLGGHRAYKWVRPAETDRVRMLAAIDEFLGHLSLDVTYVLNTNNEDLPAKTYITEDIFGELQTDCGDPTAKTMFIYERAFHWHRQNEGVTAGLEIVDPSTADGITKFALVDASPPQRSKDAMDLAVDVLATNDAGDTYSTTDATAQTLHDSSGMRHERLIEGGSRTLAQITTMANRLLSTYKVERVTYAGTLGPLTTAQVKLLEPGALITVTNAVWGLTASTQRIGGMTLRYMHPDLWMVDLQLGYKARLRIRPIKETSKSTGGTGEQSDGSRDEECCPPFVCDSTDFAVRSDAGADVMALVFPNHMNGQSAESDPGTANSDAMYLYFGATYKLEYYVYHSPFSSALQASLAPVGGASYASTRIDMGYADTACYLGPPTDIPYATMDWTSDYLAGGDPLGGYMVAAMVEANCVVNDSYASSLSVHITWLSGPDPRFEGAGACSNGVPNINQQVIETPKTGTTGSGVPGDGVTTTGTTDNGFAYIPGSLTVKVNGLDWTKDITETDPTAGTYDYLYAPPLGATIQVIHNYAGPV